jgi:putative NADPH-quinone reductase
VRVLANVFHPQIDQSRVTRRWAEYLIQACIETRFHGAEPLDIPAEQAACERADRLLFVHPMHWYSGPWPLKRWIDEVLTCGWAYGEGSHLAGKEWVHAVSVGAGMEEYGPEGSRRYTVEEFMRPFERTAGFCGATYREPFLFYGAGYRGDDDLAESAQALLEFARSARS